MKPARWARIHNWGDDLRHHLAAWDRDGFARLLRAEFTKFRTVRAWMIALCAAAVVFVLLSFASALVSRAHVPAVPTGPGGEAVSDTYMFVHQALAGDGTLTARVASLSGAHTAPSPTAGNAFGTSSKSQPGSQLQPGLAPWAKAGIILEPDTSQGTAYAAVMVTGSHGVQMQYNYTHDSPGLAAPPRRPPRGGCGSPGPGTSSPAMTPPTAPAGPRSVPPAWPAFPARSRSGCSSPPRCTSRPGPAAGLPAWPPPASTRSPLEVTFPAARGPETRSLDFYPVASASTWHQSSAGTFTITGSGDIAPLVGDIISAQWAGASIVNGTIFALLLVIVLATLFATSEYRRGLIRTTFAASPRRGQVLAAKAIVAGSLAFAAGAIATAIAEGITRHVLAANGSYLFPQSGPAVARVIIGTGLFLGLAAALAVALGMMLRRGAVAVTAGVVLLVLPGILGSQSGNWLMRLTPTAAFAIQATLPRSSLVTSAYTPPNGYFPISPWAGLAVLAAYTAVALGAATWLLRRRDA